MAETAPRGTVLVTGATGYIGSRLVPVLLQRGWRVRVLSRSAERIAEFEWADRVEVVEGSATEDDQLGDALRAPGGEGGVDVAYYLIHSMDGEGDFVERDRALAEQFAQGCDRAGVARVVYLGGLYPDGEELSPHLGSRKEVEQVLLAAATPAVVLRAAVILGSGSASFEMLRHLTERLPAMVGPTWLQHRIQPIAVVDALHYLAGAAEVGDRLNRGFDIGGEEVFTYRQMIQRFAKVAGLPPRLIGVLPSGISPGLASQWVGLVTPVPTGLAAPLVGSLAHEVVCDEHDIADHVGEPSRGRQGFDDAVRDALAEAGGGLADAPASLAPTDPDWAGPTRHTDRCSSVVEADLASTWQAVREVSAPPALRRLGGWRESEVEAPRRLELTASLAITGRTTLTIDLAELAGEPERTALVLTTSHQPRGSLGRLGWPASLPLRVIAQLLTTRAVALRAAGGTTG